MKYTNIPLNCSKQNSDVTSKGMKCNKILTKKSTSRLVFVLKKGRITNIHHNAQINQRK